MKDMIDSLAESDEAEDRAESEPKIYGVVVGRVVNVLDPLFLGRVQVQVPSIDALDLSAWARVAAPGAGFLSGFYWIPNPEDEVLVAFERGDINAPYVIGGLWSALAPPPLPSPVPQIRTLRTPLGNQIIFTEEPPSVVITVFNGLQSILMTPEGNQVIGTPNVNLIAGPNTVNMTPAGVTITAVPTVSVIAGANTLTMVPGGGVTVTGVPNINLVAGGSLISLTPAGIVMAGTTVTVTAAAAVAVVAGGAVGIAGGANVSILGTSVLVAGAVATVGGTPPHPL